MSGRPTPTPAQELTPTVRQAAALAELLAVRRPQTTPGELAVFQRAVERFLDRYSPRQLERVTREMARSAHHITANSVATFVAMHCRRAGRGKSEQARRRAAAERVDQLAQRADAQRAPALEWEEAYPDDRSDYWRGRLQRCYPVAVKEVLAEWRAAGRGPERPGAGAGRDEDDAAPPSEQVAPPFAQGTFDPEF